MVDAHYHALNCGSIFLDKCTLCQCTAYNFIPQVSTHVVQNGELCLSAPAWVLYPGSGGRLIPTPVLPIRNYDCGIPISHQQAPPPPPPKLFDINFHNEKAP